MKKMKIDKMKKTTRQRFDLIIKYYKERKLEWDFNSDDISKIIFEFGNNNDVYLGIGTIKNYIPFLKDKLEVKKPQPIEELFQLKSRINAPDEIIDTEPAIATPIRQNDKYNLTLPPLKMSIEMNGRKYTYKLSYEGVKSSYFVKCDDYWTINKGNWTGQKILTTSGELHPELSIPLSHLYARMLFILNENNLIDWLHREGIEFDVKIATTIIKLIRKTEHYHQYKPTFDNIDLKHQSTLDDFSL
jgi:hypothetical protein